MFFNIQKEEGEEDKRGRERRRREGGERGLFVTFVDEQRRDGFSMVCPSYCFGQHVSNVDHLAMVVRVEERRGEASGRRGREKE